MGLKSKWRDAKAKLEKAKMDTGVFKENASGALDDFDEARKKFEGVPDEVAHDDPKRIKLRTKLARTCDELGRIGAKYEDLLRYLADRATDSTQKKATEGAASFWFDVMRLTNDVKQNLTRKPPTTVRR